MQKKNAQQLLEFMISALLLALNELSSSSNENEFCYGQKTAYVECLEWLQQWEHAEAHGLRFNAETKFPL